MLPSDRPTMNKQLHAPPLGDPFGVKYGIVKITDDHGMSMYVLLKPVFGPGRHETFRDLSDTPEKNSDPFLGGAAESWITSSFADCHSVEQEKQLNFYWFIYVFIIAYMNLCNWNAAAWNDIR